MLQLPGFEIKPGNQVLPMTFRSRRPTNHDVAEDTRATGGNLDIRPEGGVYETTVLLPAGQTIEYNLLGRPAPATDAFPKISGSYRFPPFPPDGAPGIAFQWMEMEGPILPASWPPPSHRVLFDDLGVDLQPAQPEAEARRLLRRFLPVLGYLLPLPLPVLDQGGLDDPTRQLD